RRRHGRFLKLTLSGTGKPDRGQWCNGRCFNKRSLDVGSRDAAKFRGRVSACKGIPSPAPFFGYRVLRAFQFSRGGRVGASSQITRLKHGVKPLFFTPWLQPGDSA
ncbi:MAG: hypothetical protein ACOC10_09640, partial [Bacteroidota bacterium]